MGEAVYSYIRRPAKRLRPGILLFCCGAVGGREEQALYASAAVEVYHTWTLVHDDLIDNDRKRRGEPTVHEEFRLKALDWGYSETAAAELGRNVAILAGDLQHAWSIRLLLDSLEAGVPPQVVLDLTQRFESEVTTGLVEGEALDVLYTQRKITGLSEAEIIRMLELKTGVLYEFAGIAGASIGLGQTAAENELIQKIGRFSRRCGIAFQLQDDVLGVTGDEKLLGKPVGSDIREGKRTIIVLHAYQQAGPAERRFLETHLGNPALTDQELQRIKEILLEYNGIKYTRNLAESIIDDAIRELDPLPDSRYKDLLLTWAQYIVDRDF
ncbi:MAG: polyprenyl synthetase family protein [Firmicutes bacterium]|nr:polyprenyl synthetase family protein [Bacillota bacterium]